MTASTYHKLSKKIHKVVKHIKAYKHIKAQLPEVVVKSGSNDSIVDTTISCDGTWQRRGFSSFNRAVVCISVDTGRVLDAEVLSRYCQSCVRNEKLKTSDRYKFEQFKTSHEQECLINHKGSAPAMEMVGAESIFKRSIVKNILRYTKFLGDSDAKSFAMTGLDKLFSSNERRRTA